MPYTWIVTKTQPHADSVVIQLRRQGFDARALCCLEHQWLGWPGLERMGAAGPALLFVTSRAAAARIEVPPGTPVAAVAPVTSSALEARGIKVNLTSHGGVRELAQAVVDSPTITSGSEIFYPTSDVALRQPEHLAGVATLSSRFTVRTHAVYSTVAPGNLAQELVSLREAPSSLHYGFAFWSPSAIENFSAAGGFDLTPGPAVLVGGSTERCWGQLAPAAWRRALRHDAQTPLEWSLRFIERGASAGGDLHDA